MPPPIEAGAVPININAIVSSCEPGCNVLRSPNAKPAVRADADAWTRFWQPLPEPGFHDLLAMSRFGRAVIEGDLQPFMANLRYFKEVLEAPRRAMAAATPSAKW